MWVQRTEELCRSCYYMTGSNGTYKASSASCDYIGIEGHSRIFEGRKLKEGYKKGYCDCYKPKEEGVNNKWKSKSINTV